MLEQDFSVSGINEKWVAEVYIPTREGWLFLAAILGLFSRKISRLVDGGTVNE